MTQTAMRDRWKTIRIHRRRHTFAWWLGRWPLVLHRWHVGALAGKKYLIVTHRGRRTGRFYRTAVMVLRTDPTTSEVYVAAGTAHADWLLNIEAAPPLEVVAANRQYEPTPRFLSTEELANAIEWSRAHHPRSARIQALFFRWPWPANHAELVELAGSLRGVAFRPRAFSTAAAGPRS